MPRHLRTFALVSLFLFGVLGGATPARAQQVPVTIRLIADGAGAVGDNWISLPNATRIRTAEQLCAAIGPTATSVAQFFPDVNRRYTWDCAGGAGACTTTNPGGTIPEPGCSASSCFCIDDGEGYDVRVSADTNFAVDGCESPVTISLPAGSPAAPGRDWLVSVPYTTTLITYNDLAIAAGLPSTGLNRGIVTGINPVTGALITCSAGTAPCTAALLVRGQAYRLRYLTDTPAPFANPTPSGPCVDFDITLVATGAGAVGTNWISLPTTTYIRTAEDLCAEIGPNATTVAQFFPDVNRRYTWTCAGGAGACATTNPGGTIPEAGCTESACFCMDDGEGYEVKVTVDTPLHIVGCESQVTINLPGGSAGAGGTNYLTSVPFVTPLATWNDLALAAGVPTGLGGGTVTGLNPVTGAFSVCLAGTAQCMASPLVTGRAYQLRYNNVAPAPFTNPATRVAPCATCGNGLREAFDEECDRGNLANADCCSAVCQFDPAGAACCGAGICDGSGFCATDPVAGTADDVMVTGFSAATGYLSITYTPACQAGDHTIYWGPLTTPWSGLYTGQACGNSCSGAATFNPGPGPIFFLIAPDDGTDEGSYGLTSAGAEIPEASGLLLCDYPQNLANVCP